VLKAAQIATVEPGPDSEKRIHQRHFIQGMAEVMAAENVMSQSLFDDPGAGPIGGVMERLAEGQEELRGDLGVLVERLDSLDQKLRALSKDHSSARGELERQQVQLAETYASGRRARDRMLLVLAAAATLIASAALAVTLLR
jgi:hypothetical protein